MSAGDRAGSKACPTGKIRHKIRMNVYPCRSCGGWHVGHKRGLKADIARALKAGSTANRSHRSRRNRR